MKTQNNGNKQTMTQNKRERATKTNKWNFRTMENALPDYKKQQKQTKTP